MVYFYGKNCSDCIQAGKNLEPLIPEKFYNRLPDLIFVNEEVDIYSAGPSDYSWSHCKYSPFCKDIISKFPSSKITPSTSAKTIVDFLTNYIHLQEIPISTGADFK